MLHIHFTAYLCYTKNVYFALQSHFRHSCTGCWGGAHHKSLTSIHWHISIDKYVQNSVTCFIFFSVCVRQLQYRNSAHICNSTAYFWIIYYNSTRCEYIPQGIINKNNINNIALRDGKDKPNRTKMKSVAAPYIWYGYVSLFTRKFNFSIIP